VPQNCVVFIPHKFGGQNIYEPHGALSSMDAAWKAIQDHERRKKAALMDDVILHVVVDGITPSIWNWQEHNASKPNFRHRDVCENGRNRKAGVR
jgi:hypothetical protein